MGFLSDVFKGTRYCLTWSCETGAFLCTVLGFFFLFWLEEDWEGHL